MKFKNLLLMSMVLLLTSCNNSNVCVDSVIVGKREHSWLLVTYAGTVICIPQHDYYFDFNECKLYTKKVSRDDYFKYDIGDLYYFSISENEKEYFYCGY